MGSTAVLMNRRRSEDGYVEAGCSVNARRCRGRILEGVTVSVKLTNNCSAMRAKTSLKECKCRRTTRMNVGCGWTKRRRRRRRNEGVEVEWKVEKVGRGKPAREEASGNRASAAQSGVEQSTGSKAKIRVEASARGRQHRSSTARVKRLKAEGEDQACTSFQTSNGQHLASRGSMIWII